MEHFGRWLGQRRVGWSHVQQFLDCSGVLRDWKPNRAALCRLLEMLGQDRKQATLPQGHMGNLLRRYQEHLAKARGLAPDTIRRHLTYTRAMLSHFGIRRASQFMGWTPELIEQYVSREGRFAPSRGRNVGWCVRSFLRFLLQDGLIRRDLADAFFLKAKVAVEGKVAVRFEFACTAAGVDSG